MTPLLSVVNITVLGVDYLFDLFLHLNLLPHPTHTHNKKEKLVHCQNMYHLCVAIICQFNT